MAGLAELLHTSASSELFSRKFTVPSPVAPEPTPLVEDTDVAKPKNEEERVVFVGNVPLDVKKHDIAQEFEKYGTVEKVWKRSVPVDRGTLSIAVACIRKKVGTRQYREDGVACNFYVLFCEKAAAEGALAANGSLFRGNHLRVDLANAAHVGVR